MDTIKFINENTMLDECASQVFNKYELNQLLSKYAQVIIDICNEEYKQLNQTADISSLPSECGNGWKNSYYCIKRGKCKKCL